MSRFAIEVKLDDLLQANPSKGVSGTLKVMVNDECKCRKLVLYCQSGLLEPEELDKNKVIDVTVAKWETWEAGEEYSYPFHFEVDGSWTGRGEQEGSTIEWFFLPEIHITGEFQPDTSSGWIPPKNNRLEANAVEEISLDDKGLATKEFEKLISDGGANLETGDVKKTYENDNLISAELAVALDGLEDILNEKNSAEIEKRTTTEGLGLYLRVYFDNSDRRYRIGEKITGNIIVRAFGDTEIDRLGLVYQWRTHGRAELEEGELNQITVSKNEKWEFGQLYEYRFSFVIDDGPTTYRGHNQNLDWYIWPVLEIVGDPVDEVHHRYLREVAEQDFLLLPAEKSELVVDTKQPNNMASALMLHRATIPEPEGWKFIIPSIVVSILGLLTMLILWIQDVFDFSWWVFFVSLILLVLGGWALNEVLSYKLAEVRLGKVNVEVTSPNKTNRIRTQVLLRPPKKVRLEKVLAKLIVQERVTVRQGTGTSTKTKDLYTALTGKQISKFISPGKQYSVTINSKQIPERVPVNKSWGTLDSGGEHEIVWSINIKIFLNGWFNWSRTLPIEVRRSLGLLRDN